MATAEYTKKAVKNYQAKFDLIQVRFPKGIKEEILEKKGKDTINDFIVSCVMDRMAQQRTETAQKSVLSDVVENVPDVDGKGQENEDTSGLTPMGEVLDKILAEHTKKS